MPSAWHFVLYPGACRQQGAGAHTPHIQFTLSGPHISALQAENAGKPATLRQATLPDIRAEANRVLLHSRMPQKAPNAIRKGVPAVRLPAGLHRKMNIDITALSRLAHLALTEEEQQRFSEELDGILAFMAQTAAEELPTEADTAAPPAVPPLREDIPVPFPVPERILVQAPDTAQGLIRVPAVLRDE